MLTEDDFDDRIQSIYKQQSDRLKAKLKQRAKSSRAFFGNPVPYKLPFTREELSLHVWRVFGLNARPCRYCSRPIDILSLSADHHHPLKYGGTWGLDNLDFDVCSHCNSLKGALPYDDWMILRDLFFGQRSGLSPVGRAELENILVNAGAGMAARYANFAKNKPKVNRGVSASKQRALLNIHDDF